MIYSIPLDTVVATFDGIPTGLVGSIGAQIQRASNGTVVRARSDSGIAEVPAGSGNYVISTIAPSEQDVYLLVLDWSGGLPSPDTSRVEELRVTATLPIAPSGLGPVADAAKSHMGETFDALVEASHYGSAFVASKVVAVKRRLMNNPPATVDEDDLDPLVIDYLGKLTALELIPAAYDYWATQAQTKTIGNDPSETISYPDRIRALEKLQEALLRQTRHDEVFVLPLLSSRRSRLEANTGPAIDEFDDCKVTSDPRNFPTYENYPYHRRDRVIS